ncbi:MAG TPA: pyruvate kinase, partial [Eubacteriaceae bacterium]|nr:pyruvate kinase [Eubacteriaceae bacterium]
MTTYHKVSTGIEGFDRTIDQLRLGDNVVWQVDSVSDYQSFVSFFVNQAVEDERNLIYIRFGSHEPLVEESQATKIYRLNAEEGFEHFGIEIHDIITKEGVGAFYVFDCLSELLKDWHSDLMIGNFFKITCPYLYELDTIAYFAILRNTHTYATIARIRETTQVLFDLYSIQNEHYVHPLKVCERYSPTMFMPHRLQKSEFQPVTASSDIAELFSNTSIQEERKDYWDQIFDEAKESLFQGEEAQRRQKTLLINLLIGRGRRIRAMSEEYFDLEDLLNIHARQIGTGFIGGKSAGMLLARKILEVKTDQKFLTKLEQHDSFYLGSDIFYTYLVQNNLWKLRTKQRKREGYFQYAKEMREKILHGKFPEIIKEQFQQMLEYFGQSPIIVRSSSLLEDNFGNAFAGKYESVFCINQGSPQKRYEAFSKAVRTVYASTLDEEALSYRLNRGLFDKDEQMALLVQRVSGDYHDSKFFPHLAGVGNSTNLYVWEKQMDPLAGMLRLVFGLGTRAVDRVTGDYPRLIALDHPDKTPLFYSEDEGKFSQKKVDVLDLEQNELTSLDTDQVLGMDIKVEKDLFAKRDLQKMMRLKELGYKNREAYILSFEKLLKETDFAGYMRRMLDVLAESYDYPVDIEFTVNFDTEQNFRVNLVQCRPLQTKGLGKSIGIPALKKIKECFFYLNGNFMGGNIHLPISHVVFVDHRKYIAMSEGEKYSVARDIGEINRML